MVHKQSLLATLPEGILAFAVVQCQPLPADVGDEEPASSWGIKIAAVRSCSEANMHPNVGAQFRFQLGKDGDVWPQGHVTGW